MPGRSGTDEAMGFAGRLYWADERRKGTRAVTATAEPYITMQSRRILCGHWARPLIPYKIHSYQKCRGRDRAFSCLIGGKYTHSSEI